jgi:hypothetical protein
MCSKSMGYNAEGLRPRYYVAVFLDVLPVRTSIAELVLRGVEASTMGRM